MRIGEGDNKQAKLRRSPWLRKTAVAALALIAAALSCWAEPVSSNTVARAVNTLIAQNGQMGCPIEGPVSSVRLCTVTNGAAFYVAKLEGGGFVVTSTDTEIDPIIAISSGPDLVEDSRNPLWALLVRDMATRQESVAARNKKGARLTASTASGAAAMSPAAVRWARLTTSGGVCASSNNGRGSISDVRVAPLLKTKWGQDWVGGDLCFNYYTPYGYVCGCTATATAQILRYHKFPTEAVTPHAFDIMVDGFSERWPQMGGTYEWNNMPEVPDSRMTTAQREAIGKLTYDVGLAVNFSYTWNSTGGHLGDMIDLCIEWGYAHAHDYHESWWENITPAHLRSVLIPNLDAKLPVGVGLTSGDMGHAVVADGYGYLDGQQLGVHLNLGWDGDCDAWYILPGTVFAGGDNYFGIDILCGNIYPHGPKRGGIASGRVLSSATRAPISGVVVTASNSVGKVIRTTTDANGIYAFILLAREDPEYGLDDEDEGNGGDWEWRSYEKRTLSASDAGMHGTTGYHDGDWGDDDDDDDDDDYWSLPYDERNHLSFDRIESDDYGGYWIDDDVKEVGVWTISLENASPALYTGEIWDCKNYYGLDFSLQDPSKLRTLTFDANGGSVSPAAWSTPSGSAVGVLPTPTRIGHSFVGWYTAREGGSPVTPETVMVPYNVTLYAHWAVKSYKIWLDADDGSVSPAEVSVAYGSAIGALPTPKWAGHAFAGWYTAPEGGVRVTPETLMVPYDVTLYAHWEGVVTGSCADHPIPFSFGASVAAYPVSLTRELLADMSYDYGSGVLFCRSSVRRGKVYTIALPAGQAFEVSCDAPAGEVDYVTFGGLRYGLVDVRGISAGSANVLLRINGGVGARTTVYVVEGDYLAKRLLFDPNGGSCPVASKAVRAGQEVGELPGAKLDGSAFQGWFTAREGGSRVTAATVMVGYDVTLYARWEAIAFGSHPGKPVPFAFSPRVTTYQVSLAKEWLPEDERYDDASGVLYCKSTVRRGNVYTLALPAGQEFEVTCGGAGAVVEYAPHGALRYCRVDARGLSAASAELVLAAYGAAGARTTVYAVEGDLVPADAAYEDPGVGGFPGSCLGKATSFEFAASVQAKVVRLVREWDEGAGECVGGGVHYLRAAAPVDGRLTVAVPVSQAEGCEVACAGTAAVREDFGALALWIFDAQAGDEVVVRLPGVRGADATVYTFGGDYLAKKLVFDPNGGTCPEASREVRAGVPVGELPVPDDRAGHAFLGWYTAREGGARVTEATVMVGYDVTLYAHWEKLAAGSCQEAAIPFAMTTSVAAYPVSLAREWLEDELKYSDADGAFYCRTTLRRGRVYTMAVPKGLDQVNAWCVNGEASVAFGSDASLQYVRFDTTKMAAAETEAYFAVFGDAGQRTTVYAVEADVMPKN